MYNRLNEQAKAHLGASAQTVILAQVVYQTVDRTFDYVAYPAVLLWKGPLWGGITMTVAAALLNLVYLLIYQRTGVDWLGIGLVKKAALVAEESDHIAAIRNKRFRWLPVQVLYDIFKWFLIVPAKATIWGVNRGKVASFLVLSTFQDSFVTAAFFRHGKTGKLDARDWQIFFGSLLVSNIYWTVRWGVIVEIARAAWNWFF